MISVEQPKISKNRRSDNELGHCAILTIYGFLFYEPTIQICGTVCLVLLVLDKKKRFPMLINTQTNVQTSRAEIRQIILFEGLLAICGLSKAVPKNQMFIVYPAMDSNQRKLS